MTAVTVRFTTKGHIGSRIAACLAEGAQFNHCMLIYKCVAYETLPWIGVRAVPVESAMRGVVCWQDMEIDVPVVEAMRSFIHDQIRAGAGYDWPAALGMPFRRAHQWEDPARWWCYELTVAGARAGSCQLIERGKPITPNSVYSSKWPKSAIQRIKK